MKCVLLLSYSIVLTLTIFEIVEAALDYGSLINDVYNKYMTRSIILVHAKNFFFFEKISFHHRILRNFSARRISSLILNDMQLRARMRYHSRESHRPLVVIFIDELDALQKFSEEVQHFDSSYSQQLIVFFGDSDEDHCKYGRDPIGNAFNFKFNSEMLIMCCESEYIEEWWSRRENQTNTMPRGEWIEGADEVKWYPKRSISVNRLSMDNRGFRIVIVKGSPCVWRENDQLYGYMGEIFMALSRHMNFSISAVIEENVHGSLYLESSMGSGAIGTIVRGTTDMGVADFRMTSDQIHYIDFTVPLLTIKRVLFIRKPDDFDILWDACFKPFHGRVWMAIVIFLLMTPLLLTIIKYRRKDNFFDIMSQHYLNVWGIFCQRPLSGDCHDSPYGTSLRIVYISIHVMAVVLSTAYSASFVSFLTTTPSNLPFYTWEEFTQDETYKLTLLRENRLDGFKESNEELYEKLKAKMLPIDSLPRSRTEGLEQICTQKLAFYDADIANHNYSPCKIVAIPIGGVQNFAMSLPLKSEYTKAMNHFLRRFEYNGMTTRLKNKYFAKKAAAHTYYDPVTFRGILPILIVSAVGFSVAFVIFCVELPRNHG